jgi:XTP/dITP diphosphohydrolase
LRNWERIKNQEKSREDIFDGVPTGQPALSLATKYLQRAMKNSKEMPTVETNSDLASLADGEIGQALLAIIRVAVEKGIDPESELRRATLRYAESIDRRVESER